MRKRTTDGVPTWPASLSARMAANTRRRRAGCRDDQVGCTGAIRTCVLRFLPLEREQGLRLPFLGGEFRRTSLLGRISLARLCTPLQGITVQLIDGVRFQIL